MRKEWSESSGLLQAENLPQISVLGVRGGQETSQWMIEGKATSLRSRKKEGQVQVKKKRT